MSIVRYFELVIYRMAISVPRRDIEEYAKVREFVYAGSSLFLIANFQHEFAECCAKVECMGNNGGNKDQSSADVISARFQSQI